MSLFYDLATALCVDIPNLRHLDKHKVEARLFGRNGWITFNKEVKTDKAVTCNKPDIVDNLGQVERDKKEKYKALTKEMGNHKMNALTTIEVVPYVMTWDGLVTRHDRNYRQELGVSDRMEGQIQRICLQQTYDFVMRELGIEVMEEIEGWVQGMSRRTIPSLPDPGPMPMAAAPAVLCET
ncbi:hypothetical protein X943_002444 [Babesia divergens]|uniref:Uncharacterized protein n=1 Tax=Babesia divergens TaxID=32595 RepID=A0AAD9GE84_BABDI|nr:hypothetical protein X943_002444 [Babesia divergens]